MYCVEWNTLKARPARKSLEESRPATGLRLKPVVERRKSLMSCSCGMLSAE